MTARDPDTNYVRFTGGKLGIRFDSARLQFADSEGEAAVVVGFTESSPDEGIEDVKVGDYVHSVNGEELGDLNYGAVLEKIRSASRPLTLGFRRIKKGVKSDFRKDTKGLMLSEIGVLSREVAQAHERRERFARLLREIHPAKEAYLKKMSAVEERLDAVMGQRIHGNDMDDELAKVESAITKATAHKKTLIAEVKALREQLKAAQEAHDLVFYAHMGLRQAAAQMGAEEERVRRRSGLLGLGNRKANARRAGSQSSGKGRGGPGPLRSSRGLTSSDDSEGDVGRRARGGRRASAGAGTTGTDLDDRGADEFDGGDDDDDDDDDDAAMVVGWEPHKVKALKTLSTLKRQLKAASDARDAAVANTQAGAGAGDGAAAADGNGDASSSPSALSPSLARGGKRPTVTPLERALDKCALVVSHAEMNARGVALGLVQGASQADGPDVRALHLAVHLICQNAALQRERVEQCRGAMLRREAVRRRRESRYQRALRTQKRLHARSATRRLAKDV